ncbi:hypothetical protein [Clostridium sp. DMHC 10]|uniref:hypothetical protein n=1 Tax=Clostridium sp. DMHC 10 TaxID=747377 RepID=UPI001FA7C730|nr:hypothetical protein [Clostridium sp. DMHC 10]
MSYGKGKIGNIISEITGKKQVKKSKYVSTGNSNKGVGDSFVILKEEFNVTFNPNDETKNSVLKFSEETNAKHENKQNMSREELADSYEKQGYTVIWDNDRKVEVIKNNYINNPEVDGVFVLMPSKNDNLIHVYKVDSGGKLQDTNVVAYKKVSDLKAETILQLKKGLLVFGSKNDAKKLAGYD